MPATPLRVHPVVAERTCRILSSCQYAITGEEYAHRLVASLSAEMRSEYAIWLNWPSGQSAAVAMSGGCEAVLSPLRTLCDRAPILLNDLDMRLDLRSVAAVPMMFRATAAGVLAVANSAEGYTPTDLDVLAETGRAALAAYESLERAEALGLRVRQPIADLVHEVRQPLGVLEVCTYYLDMVLPASETKARQQLIRMREQVECASLILERRVENYVRRETRPRFEEEPAAEVEAESSRVLTNSAMSMVT
jgi:GAF domain-containing protein